MKKKEFLTEAKRKAIISEKEKAIIESFAKTFNKIKRTDERRINEDLTLQYADRPTASSPIVEIGYEDDGILHKFGFNFREDEEINLSDLFRGIETAKRGIQDAIEGASDLSAFDFQREIELVKKLSAFANQSKMDNNNVVMLKSNMNHPNQEWNDKEEKGMNDMWDLQNSQEDFDSYKYQGLSEEKGRIKEYDNYNYPAGADADPNAPWNQNDRESEYEYRNGEFEDAEPIDKNYNGPIENEKMAIYSTDGGEGIVTMGEIFKTLNVPQETIEVLRANNTTQQDFLAAREIQQKTGNWPEEYSKKVERYNAVYFPIMEKYGNEHAEYQYEIEQDDDYGPDGDDYDDRDDRDDDREWGGVDGW